MRKLIIGCGYLGERVGRLWHSQGDEVWALTRSESRAEAWRARGWRAVVGDVVVPETLAALPEVDTILYAVGLDRSSGHSQRTVYVDGLRHVLRHVAASTPRFLYVSSTSVYGQSAGEWIDETSPTEPITPSGSVCLEAERLVWEFFPGDPSPAATTARGANILRLAGIYGPGRLVARLEALRQGEPLEGEGEAWLNLIHVDDAARSVLACEQFARPGRTYLIADDEPVRRQDFYGYVAARIDAPPVTFIGVSTDGSVAASSGIVSPIAASELPRTPGSPKPRTPGLNKRCRNARLHDELRLALHYSTYREGLQQAMGDRL